MKKKLTKKTDGVTGYEFLYAEEYKEAVGIIIGVDPVLNEGLKGRIISIDGNFYWDDENEQPHKTT
jgi:hypothetical protein